MDSSTTSCAKGSELLNLSPGYTSSFTPKEWVLPNYTEFPKWVSDTFKENKDIMSSKQTCDLYPHQRFIRNFMGSLDSPYRGILLYHGLGTGKTITSISVAEALSSERKIVVMLPASLVRNYINEIISCGNTGFNRLKSWTFYPTAHPDYPHMSMKMKSVGVDVKLMSKNKGVWVFCDHGKSRSSNYETLDEDGKNQVNGQIESMVRKRYTFLHYNGLSLAKVRALGPNYFENKIVIIDEVHNFVSGIKNSSLIRNVLYETIMQTADVKIIGLSGTPIINEPYEIAYLANLIHGPMEMIVVHLQANRFFNQNIAQLQSILDKHLFVDHYEILEKRAIIRLKLVPPGFERVSETSYRVSRVFDSSRSYGTPARVLEVVIQELVRDVGVTIRNVTSDSYLLLPEDKEEFDEHFLSSNGGVKNSIAFMRRLQGIISYYASSDGSEFPKVSKMQIVRPEMPVQVFEKYRLIRDKERKQEIDSRKYEAMESKTSMNVYKAFSRALCLFRFPDAIPREYPSDLKKAARQELDFIDDDIMGDMEEANEKIQKNKGKALKSDYKSAKAHAMQQLRLHADKYLTGEALKTYGIKYFEVLKRIRVAKGPVLIYSHFREVEGIGIMKEVLNAHGFIELNVENQRDVGWSLQLPTDKSKWMSSFYVVFTQDKVKNKVLMDIFNSDAENLPQIVRQQIKDILMYRDTQRRNNDETLYDGELQDFNLRGDFVKTMMITQSGSEGISLKHVRQVHILEPYWNPIRIKQVIGRAVRVNSHLRLPEKDRVVDVYMYVMSLGKNSLPQDKNLSSDEAIENIAMRKNEQVESFQHLIQKTAFDCRLNLKTHDHVKKCFSLPKSYGKYAYTYGTLEDDPSDINIFQNMKRNSARTPRYNEPKPKKPRIKISQMKGEKVYYIEDTKELLDPIAYDRDKTRVIIGHIVEENGKKRLIYTK